MKTKAVLFAWVILSSFWAGQTTVAQRRGAVWVHGLNDTSVEWNTWANLFTNERQLFSRNQLVNNGQWTDYRSQDGVAAMTNNVRNSYGGAPDNRSIYFSQSMGGVVGRDIDVNHTGDFGGIITAGSPLDGARIANTARSGEAAAAIYNGVDRILEGPVRELGYILRIDGSAVDAVVLLLVAVLDRFGLQDRGNEGVTDLQEGSGYLSGGTRNAQTPTPKIHIYGNEEGLTVWRIVSQAAGNGDDEQYVRVARTAGDVYEVAMWVNYGVALANLVSFNFWGAAYFIYVAEGWSRGMNWWRYDSERGWNHLIGADIPATQTVCYTDFNWQGFNDCMNQLGGQQATYEDYMRCQNQSTYQNCYTYYSSQNGQSDAFIKASS